MLLTSCLQLTALQTEVVLFHLTYSFRQMTFHVSTPETQAFIKAHFFTIQSGVLPLLQFYSSLNLIDLPKSSMPMTSRIRQIFTPYGARNSFLMNSKGVYYLKNLVTVKCNFLSYIIVLGQYLLNRSLVPIFY